MTARARRVVATPRALVPAGLWLAVALVSGFTAWRYLEGFDEGLLLQAATRMTDGQWPWRDFGWAYGPGQPLVVAGAFKLLGPSVLWWRLLRVIVDATTAVIVFALVRDRAGVRPALLAGAAAGLTAAQPVSANAANTALLFALAAVWLASRDRPAWAGVAAALALFWRPDLGVAAILAAAVTSAGSRHAALRVVVAAGVAALALYLPFLIAAGPRRVVEALALDATRDGAWWRLPFPPGYTGELRADHLAADLKDLLGWLLPYVAALGSIAAIAAGLRRRTATPADAGLAVLALACAVYWVSRADEFHAQLLMIVACLLLAIGAAEARGETGSRGAATAATALLVALGLLVLGGAANRLSALLRPPDLVAIHLPGVPGIGVPPAEARALPPLVALVQRLVPSGEPIYVAPRRSDLVTTTVPIVHFLVRRPNVLHRDALLQARPAEQRAIVAALRRAHPKVVVRWTSPASSHPEPNARGRPSGSRALDTYLAAAYALRARFGDYDVLVARD